MEQGKDYVVEMINLNRVEVTGLQFHDYAMNAQELVVGTELQLIREAFNEFDRKAIAVYRGSNKIGFVAREENNMLHVLLDRGVPLYGYVTEHDTERGITKGNRRLMMAVYMPYTFLLEQE